MGGVAALGTEFIYEKSKSCTVSAHGLNLSACSVLHSTVCLAVTLPQQPATFLVTGQFLFDSFFRVDEDVMMQHAASQQQR